MYHLGSPSPDDMTDILLRTSKVPNVISWTWVDQLSLFVLKPQYFFVKFYLTRIIDTLESVHSSIILGFSKHFSFTLFRVFQLLAWQTVVYSLTLISDKNNKMKGSIRNTRFLTPVRTDPVHRFSPSINYRCKW